MTRKLTNLGDNFVIGFEGTAMTPALAKLLARIQPAGVILFRRNITDAEQTWQLLRDCQRQVAQPLFTCVDMEGGTVDRLRDIFGPSPSAASVFETADLNLFRRHGKAIGAICRAAGFNVDFAPTLDLSLPPSLPVMGSRVVSANPHEVTSYARAFLRGLSDSRVLGCGKHFPGLGEVSLDTHKDLPVVEKTMRRLLAEDVEPYRALRRDLPFVMICHAIYATATRDQTPASLSKKWMTDILRRKVGYTGLAITDDMEMHAVSDYGSYESIAERALLAGNDVVMFCSHIERIPDIQQFLGARVKDDKAFRIRVEDASRRAAAYRQHIDYVRRDGLPPAANFDDIVDETSRFVEAFQKARHGKDAVIPEVDRRKDSRTPGTGRTGREEWT